MSIETPPNPARKNSPWNEVMGLILIFGGFVLSLALLSYNADDPSWTSTGAYGRARNWVGPIGAHIASFIYQALGFAGWLIPVVLFTMGWWQWKDTRVETTKAELVGMFLIIISITGFLTLIPVGQHWSFRLGGFIGYWLVRRDSPTGLARFIGTGGAFVAMILLLTIGLLLATPFSVTALLKKLSEQYPQMGIFRAMFEWAKSKWLEHDVEKEERERQEKLREIANQRAASTTPRSAGAAGPVISYGNEDGLAKTPRKVPSRKSKSSGAPAGDENGYGTVSLETGDESRSSAFTADAGATAARSARQSTVTLDPGGYNNGASAQTRQKMKSEPNSEYDNDDSAMDDSDDDSPRTPRSVEEMVAGASIKHADLAEENAPAKPPSIATKIARVMADYKLPSTEMLSPAAAKPEMAEAELLERARQLAEKCAEFNVSGQVKQISPGPVVTTFELKLDSGVKYSRITSLVDDLCLGLKAESIRIDRIPGKSTVGIEVPNDRREVIRLREVIESKKFRDSESKLTLALGKTIDGSNYSADLARMPHLLIAGATGAGKSVALNAILLSLLYKSTPDEVKLILVDPKRLELGLYADLPHLLTPIVTDPKRAGYALKWAVSEMENRYKHLAAFGVRNIEQYNTEVCGQAKARTAKGIDENAEEAQPLPYIVVIIDELADLMMVAAREVEESITRLAQMARAVGIHLVLATQRPSVDVITGLIKANFPSRISFRVSSKVDSRTIIDTNGAEGLLGQGDMLFLGPGTSRLVRIHGAYVDEKECKRICDFIRSQGNPAYNEKIIMNEKESGGSEGGDFAKDDKYDDAVRIIVKSQKASTSLLQRHLRIGYGRAASIIDMMEREGIVGSEDGTKPRQVMVKPDFVERLDQMREEGDL